MSGAVAQTPAEQPEGRRIARFSVTPEILLWMGSGKFEVVASPLPEDVKPVGAFYDERRHCFTVVVESDSFAPVEGGEVPEVAAPVIRALKTDE